MYDAIIIGAGPNGLSAGIQLIKKGLSVKIVEAADTIGGGTRTKELTLPGFHHDVCSAIHPMAAGSPFFRSLPLEQYGLEWIHPEYPVAHPLDDRPAVIFHRSLYQTAHELGKDEKHYRKLFSPLVNHWDDLASDILGPFNLLPAHPLLLGRFGLKALQPAMRLAKHHFKTERARALFGGLAAHGIMPLNKIATSAIGLVMGITGHKVGWPIAKGGSHQITKALASYFRNLGGDVETGIRVSSLEELPDNKVTVFNNTPSQILTISEQALPSAYANKLKSYKYGPGVFKIDIALDGPVPWKDERCREAGTVHLGGTLQEIALSEQQVKQGKCPDQPFVLLAQQSIFDDSRAPDGKHTVWAYCHVPNGHTKNMSEPILQQIERFAPGFRDQILNTHTMNSRELEAYNPNYIGGDIIGGRQDITQLFTRPTGLLDPYHIPKTNLFICSSSTPPGGSVHGMCGYHAAESVLRYLNRH